MHEAIEIWANKPSLRIHEKFTAPLFLISRIRFSKQPYTLIHSVLVVLTFPLMFKTVVGQSRVDRCASWTDYFDTASKSQALQA